MAITRGASVLAQSAAGNTITSGAIDTSGASLIVVAIADYSGATAATLSDSKGNSWTALTTRTGGTVRMRQFYAANPVVGSGHTFTATVTGGFPAIHAVAYNGAATTSPFDQQNGGNNDAGVTSQATGSVTPSEDNEALVAAMGYDVVDAPTSPSVDSSFAIVDSAVNVSGAAFGLAVADRIQTTAAAANPQLSWTTASGVAYSISTYKQAAAAATATRPDRFRFAGQRRRPTRRAA